MIVSTNYVTMPTRGMGDLGQGDGLFASGLDFSQWTGMDWAIAGLGVYVAWSVFFTTRRGVKAVRRGGRRVKGAVTRAPRRVAGAFRGAALGARRGFLDVD